MKYINHIDTEDELVISGERYAQLIRAEHDANMLKALIADKVEGYGALTRDDLKTLYAMFISKKEEDNV